MTSRKRKRKRKLDDDECNICNKKQKLNSDEETVNNKHSIRREIKSWIDDEMQQLKLLHAQKCCVFVSTDECLGSGVCIDPKGIILTAKHCIGDNIQISFADHDGKQSDIYKKCECISMSDKYDLALIQIHCNDEQKRTDTTTTRFPFTKISPKYIKKRDRIYIIGHPANSKRLKQKHSVLQQNICGGKIISVSKNALLKEQNVMGGIKHNCVTFGGHSGAPLLDINGDVVGIHITCDNFEGTAVTQQAIASFICYSTDK